MLTPEFLRGYNPVPRRTWIAAADGAVGMMRRLTRTRIEVESFRPPASPVLFASNSTQRHDFIALRYAMRRRGIPVSTLAKARSFHEATGVLASRLGCIPLASRGYILLVDFVAVNGRRPSDEEYRWLRDHVDRGARLPDTPEVSRLTSLPRQVLGRDVDPRSEPYAASVKRIYTALMSETLRLMGMAVSRGHSLHIYPEGTVSRRLGVGRIGAVQVAHALGLPIVPVGMNGCPEAIRGDGMLFTGGTIRLRFGEPLPDPLAALPDAFRPFVPEDEQAHRPELLAATEALMSRIDGLLEPAYRRPASPAPAAATSTHRFL